MVIDGAAAHTWRCDVAAHSSARSRLAPGGQTLLRREVCAAPRGAAYDKGMDLVHVACSDGQLVSLPAAGGAAVRTVTLDRDLRDVVVDGERLKVSRFRTAEILTVEADGTVSGRTSPPSFQAAQARNAQRFTPGIAYKMEALPSGDGVLMVHQRGLMEAHPSRRRGYGGFDTCQTIVHPAVTMVHSNGSMKKAGRRWRAWSWPWTWRSRTTGRAWPWYRPVMRTIVRPTGSARASPRFPDDPRRGHRRPDRLPNRRRARPLPHRSSKGPPSSRRYRQ